MDKTHAYKMLSPLLLNGQHYKPGVQVELTRSQAVWLIQHGVVEPIADQPLTQPKATAEKRSGKGTQQPHQVPTADTATETQGAEE